MQNLQCGNGNHISTLTAASAFRMAGPSAGPLVPFIADNVGMAQSILNSLGNPMSAYLGALGLQWKEGPPQLATTNTVAAPAMPLPPVPPQRRELAMQPLPVLSNAQPLPNKRHCMFSSANRLCQHLGSSLLSCQFMQGRLYLDLHNSFIMLQCNRFCNLR